ncbi:MAG: 50S ribosomal protein L11 methyltransferase [Methylohalobius crimeensis]
MSWRQLSFTLPREAADAVADFLEQREAQAVTFAEEGAEELFEPPPGETPLWKHTRLTALFDMEADTRKLEAALIERFGDRLQSFRHEILPNQPWERAWLEHFRPLDFGRLWVCPGDQPPPDPEAVRLILDPGLAFGTGTHPTTAMCLKWLADNDPGGKTVIDYGCGSGILGVAALLLGADRVYACDIDPQALTATLENARKNGVAERLTCCYPQSMPQLTADIVMANILAGPLIELAQTLTALTRTGGSLVLSGILADQAEAVQQAYQADFDLQPPLVEAGWARLFGIKRT